ncbi:MAG: ribonuclease P protein component [Proteobacteria bacterium]|nr:ribonuclease P protein component [Pseudomonadota bacterium]MCH8220912.1 ribonuclease P protein component [Pseudomonadota bacterium]
MPTTVSSKDCSYQQHQRLISKADFSRIFEKNLRSSDSLFTVLGKNNDLGYARLGMAISMKIAGNAVRRNRLKRTVRESFRQAGDTLPAIDFVVMARAGAASADRSKLRHSLDRHWQKVSKKCAA